METWVILLIIVGAVYMIKNSKPSNKAIGLLNSTFSILKTSSGDVIPIDIPKEDFSEGMDEYYNVLQKVFDSETVDERKSDSSPSKILSNVFFDHTGLYEALVAICGELNYVESGSGWINYKKCLTNALGKGKMGKITKKENGVYINFNKDLSLEAEKTTYDYESEFPKYYWNIQVNNEGAEVLSCFGIPNFERYSKSESDQPKKESVLLSKFKPDYWLIKIRKVAQKYSENIEEMKLVESTEKNKAAMFR